MPELSVVIPTLNRHDVLPRTLSGLARQAPGGPSFEVLVVADAAEPNPDRVRAAVASASGARVLQAARPGASAARNLGWREAHSELVLFLGDDIVPNERLLANHADWHGRDPEPTVGVLGHVRWARELKVTPFMRWLEHGFQFDYPNIVGEDAGWGRFYTANVSVKRSMLERVGGFDEERLPFLYEDLDIGKRMSEHGFRLLYNREAVGEHLHAVEIESWRDRARQIARAEHAFVRLHPEVPPFFLRSFTEAERAPRASGRGRHLLRTIRPTTPWIGPRAWRSADFYFRQALAPDFLSAWASLEESTPASSAGPPPGGPK